MASKYRTQLAYDTGGGPYRRVYTPHVQDTKPPKGIGARIRFFRLRHQMTQYDLADNAGLSQPTVSEIERGRREPSLETISLIASVWGMTTESLLDELHSKGGA